MPRSRRDGPGASGPQPGAPTAGGSSVSRTGGPLATTDPTGLSALIHAHAAPAGRVWVAYSGGRDSAVLLHLAAQARCVLGARPLRAVYVNHGLNPDAARWGTHCAGACRALGVPLAALSVDARPARGESTQASARRARYAALGALLRPGDVLLTAHHRRDQAETVLLRALRGTGPDGLAAMAPARPLGRGWLLRPLLDWPEKRIAAQAARLNLAWIEDPANTAQRYDRAWLRTQLWPLIGARFPGAEAALARLATLARTDRAGPGAGSAAQPGPDALRVSDLRALPAPAQAAAVRARLARHGVVAPSAARLRAGLHALLTAAPDRQPELRWGNARLRRYRDHLHLLGEPPAAPVPAGLCWQPAAGPLDIPGAGTLRLHASTPADPGAGIAAARLDPAIRLDVRWRVGGERIATPAGHRELKKVFQEHGVPPWQRAHWPLLYRGDQCIAVAGLVAAEPWAARPGEPAWAVQWCPEAPGP